MNRFLGALICGLLRALPAVGVVCMGMFWGWGAAIGGCIGLTLSHIHTEYGEWPQ